MQIALIGNRGMLGHDVEKAATAAGHTVAGLDLPEFDLTDPAGVEARLPEADVVINCAAYTAVDRAETERDLADAVNAAGPGHLAAACAGRGVPLLHLSTDYVFDGEADRPYREDDPPRPLNAYGEGKLEGERRVAAAGGEALIVRVQSLFGLHGEHFIGKIRRRLESTAEPVRVVDDQVTAPTYTGHLAPGLVRLAASGRTGVVHVAASGACTWYAFARALAETLGMEDRVMPVPTRAFPTPARRPARSLLDTSRFRAWTGTDLPAWQEGLRAYLEEEKMRS